MKLKKALAMLLTTAMVLSMMTVGAFATENEENGVMPISNTEQTAPVSTLPADATNSWAASSIDRWSTAGIVKGDADGNFNPDAQLSRAELAQIFVNMLGLTEKGTNTFADLKGTEWYADAILKCAAAGIMKGDGVSANAETQISRQETVVMFGRAVGVTPDAKPDMSTFTDGNTVADWAAGYMAPLTKMGILAGSGDGTINAVGHIDRASTMALLDKSISEYVNAPGEYKVDDAKKFVVVNMAAKEGEIVISGTTAGVTVSAGTAEGKIVAKDLKADTIKMDGAAALNVEGKSSVGQVTANATGTVTIAKGVTVDTVTANAAGTITNSGTIKTLTANAPTKVDNKGTITKADVKADGVVLGGTKPTEVKVEEGTKNPTDSTGKEVPPTADKPSGGGSSGGGSVTPSVPESGIAAITAIESVITSAPIIDKYNLTFAKTGNTFKADGALAAVTGWTAFSGVAEQQNGYYVSFSIPVTDAQHTAMIAANAGNIFWMDSNFAAENGTHVGNENVYKETDVTLFDGTSGGYFINVVRWIKDATALTNASFNFSIDHDGSNNNSFAKTTYRVDLSAVTLLAAGIEGVVDMPANEISLVIDGNAGRNPKTGDVIAAVPYGTSYTAAGVTYAGNTITVDAGKLNTFLQANVDTTDATKAANLASFMNNDNKSVWATMFYTAPSGTKSARVAFNSMTGLESNRLRPITGNKHGDSLDIATFNFEADGVVKPFAAVAPQTQVAYIIWYSDDAGTVATKISKVTVSTEINMAVTYELDGGTDGAAHPATVAYGRTLTVNAPTKVGYSFAGWYTNSALTTAFNAATPVTTNITLYAKWASAATVGALANTNGFSDTNTWGTVPHISKMTIIPGTPAGNTYNLTGDLYLVDSWVKFNGEVPAEQSGYYAAVQITGIPAGVHTTETIITMGSTNKPIVKANLDNSSTTLDLIVHVAAKDATTATKTMNFTVDWDGSAATAVAPTTYTLNFSGVNLIDVCKADAEYTNPDGLKAEVASVASAGTTVNITLSGEVATGFNAADEGTMLNYTIVKEKLATANKADYSWVTLNIIPTGESITIKQTNPMLEYYKDDGNPSISNSTSSWVKTTTKDRTAGNLAIALLGSEDVTVVVGDITYVITNSLTYANSAP